MEQRKEKVKIQSGSTTLEIEGISNVERLPKQYDGKSYRVYFAEHNNKKVAIKTPRNSSTKKMLENEIVILGQISHSNIISVVGSNKKDKPCFLVMERMTEDLFMSVVAAFHFNEFYLDIALSILEKVTLAVKYLHEQNIIHCNLSVENILIKDGNPKLSGFGCAIKLKKGEVFAIKNELKGSAPYLAPETIAEKKYSKSSDMYAWAVMMYIVMVRKIPLNAYDIPNETLYARVLNNEREAVSKDDYPLISDMITLGWDQQPANRPSASSIIKSNLFQRVKGCISEKSENMIEDNNAFGSEVACFDV